MSLPLLLATAAPALLESAAPDAAREGTDGALVREARRRPDAYRRLVEKYQTRVYATALRLLGDPSEARDVAQDAFLRAYQRLDGFDPARSFGPWVCAIAANLARDHLRSPFRRFVTLGTQGHAEVSTEGDPVVDDPRSAALQAALLKLPRKLREAVVLRYVAGLSVDEVAEALRISESAAKMRLKRGVERLRDLLGPDRLED